MAAENSSGHGWRQRVKAADIARPFAVGVPAAVVDPVGGPLKYA